MLESASRREENAVIVLVAIERMLFHHQHQQTAVKLAKKITYDGSLGGGGKGRQGEARGYTGLFIAFQVLDLIKAAAIWLFSLFMYDSLDLSWILYV